MNILDDKLSQIYSKIEELKSLITEYTQEDGIEGLDFFNELKGVLIFEEGEYLKPYTCKANKLSIGVGRNLEDNGIREDEMNLMLLNDIKYKYDEVKRVIPKFDELSIPRKVAIMNMYFNLGYNRFIGFKNMVKAINEGDFDKAALELEDSKYFRDFESWGNPRVRKIQYALKHNKLVSKI